MDKHSHAMIDQLLNAGISYADALALRRIAMTLHRWHELECGDGNEWASWCIVRGQKVNGEFIYGDSCAPYEERHLHSQNKAVYTRVPDRENGAKRRLAAIMARYPALRSYIQTDPRGASLYILPPTVTPENYNRGIAVHR